MNKHPLQHFTPEEIIESKPCGSWNAGNYLLNKKSAYALEMALASKRPLLVKGEPGLGKSYLARAAASKLGRKFIAEVINGNTEGQELLWRYDPVARLNDAQAGKKGDELDPKYYLSPGVLWWAFDWTGATTQYKTTCRHKMYRPQKCSDGNIDNGVVLLIDEIDKADPSLPNSLLEVLGNGAFEVPMVDKTVGGNNKPPLVIITTNDERELPPAFTRRCLVLHLEMDEDNLGSWLRKRADVHFSDEQCSRIVKELAAKQLIEDRQEAEKSGMVKPGLAEYIDLLAALDEMTDETIQGEARDTFQTQLLTDIQDFVLKKGV